ncbi:hypothetical protein BD770DRAFT_411451 [Pilaira anomala]|nr:hypothetical protein BD770DRAFT_411451 [Pilaira anomala]
MTRTYEKIGREEYGYAEYYIDKELVYWEHTRISKDRLEQLLDQLKQQKNKDHVQVVIEFIRLLVDSMTGDEKPIESVDSLHYICVVPNRKDRPLFLSDVESLFYFTQCDKLTVPKLTSGYYKVGDHYILRRLNILGSSTTSLINLNLIGLQYSLFSISNGLQYPRVISSSPLHSINEDDIKNNLRFFLKQSPLRCEERGAERILHLRFIMYC